VGVRDKGTTIPSTDTLVTADKKAILTVTVADCLPVYIFNSSGSAVGLVHAGWQGVSKNIVSKTIKVFTQKYNIAVQDIKLIIGPHIKDCHFEVGADVAKKFQEYRNSIINRNKKIYIDLASVVKEQAVSLGVKPASIEISQDCVYCQKKYYSFRRDKPKAVEGAMAYIVMPSASLRADT
jgi:YfiH family protein